MSDAQRPTFQTDQVAIWAEHPGVVSMAMTPAAGLQLAALMAHHEGWQDAADGLGRAVIRAEATLTPAVEQLGGRP